MVVKARTLNNYIGKPVEVVSGLDIITGEVMGVESTQDNFIKVILFRDDPIDMRTYILTLDPDKLVDLLED